MRPEFTILQLHSEAAGQPFPSAMFSADTDMLTDGWISLTSVDESEIVITMVTPEEHQSPDRFLMCERRLNDELKRSDLRAVWLVRAEATGDLFYRDILAAKGEARLISKMSVADFERAGGKITYHAVA